MGSNPSYIWRSILAGQPLLVAGTTRTIGDGVDTTIWGWPWLGDSSDPHLHTPCIEELKDAKINGLMDADGGWNLEILEDLFDDSDVPRILATPISLHHLKDTWRWKDDSRGLYSVKNGYRLLTAHSMVAESQFMFTAWDLLCGSFLYHPEFVICYGGVHARNIIPVKEVLKTRNVWIGGGCPFCNHEVESAAHVL